MPLLRRKAMRFAMHFAMRFAVRFVFRFAMRFAMLFCRAFCQVFCHVVCHVFRYTFCHVFRHAFSIALAIVDAASSSCLGYLSFARTATLRMSSPRSACSCHAAEHITLGARPRCTAGQCDTFRRQGVSRSSSSCSRRRLLSSSSLGVVVLAVAIQKVGELAVRK